MTKNPLLNALAAEIYIIFVAWVMFFGNQFAPKSATFMAPIAIISLFTLSAAVMGYLFCYQPLVLYFENKKKQGLKLFLSTTLTFGLFTVIALGILFSGIIR